MAPRLYIGNKAYSSWSLRPWLAMTHFGLPFEDEVIPLDQPTTHTDILRHSPTGTVPALAVDGIVIWESLAILEYCADRHSEVAIWPKDANARAIARSVSSEMHAGFGNLRKACPMNMRRAVRKIEVSDAVVADVARIEALWAATRHDYGQGGPFLFGAFTAADAMYAPVVNRLHVYDLVQQPGSRAYMEAMMALPAWQAWLEGAKAEPWFLDKYEAI
ncbi:glutathione S-transferase family protein [Lichenihabitans sp. PAMC28606]|uniref:glutathione S-transferase family protein n=1 Tax=Lichenihabitans sp. PAMC28606 TaxID=2880932 RepID=UPI001D0BD81C|nr:glutathione S-transferase family protein [Lichenihabitans sp. PAMC28606]UDL95049.1 glutathione S-transferase family protein [Lichenihabitans sp. PAMC28606]